MAPYLLSCPCQWTPLPPNAWPSSAAMSLSLAGYLPMDQAQVLILSTAPLHPEDTQGSLTRQRVLEQLPLVAFWPQSATSFRILPARSSHLSLSTNHPPAPTAMSQGSKNFVTTPGSSLIAAPAQTSRFTAQQAAGQVLLCGCPHSL